MKCITVMNQKGGVGKTTTAANLGVALARRGRRMLLVDLDPQAHLTIHLGVDPEAGHPNTCALLTRQQPICEVRTAVEDRLWLVGSHLDLAAAESELVSFIGRETLLQDALADDDGRYDYVIIDCPPSLGVLTLNGLCAADDVLIPMQAHFLALQGVSKLLETIQLVHRRLNPRIRVSGVLLCMYESATRLGTEVTQDLNDFFTKSRNGDTPWSQTRLYETVIRRNIKLAECPSHGLSVFDYAPRSHGALDYGRLSGEILMRCEGKAALGEESAWPWVVASREATSPTDEMPVEGSTTQEPVCSDAPSDSESPLAAAEADVERIEAATQDSVPRAFAGFAGNTPSFLDAPEPSEADAVAHGAADASEALFMYDPCPAAADGDLADPTRLITSPPPASSCHAESDLRDNVTVGPVDDMAACEDALPDPVGGVGDDKCHSKPAVQGPGRPFAPLTRPEPLHPPGVDSISDEDTTPIGVGPGEKTRPTDTPIRSLSTLGPHLDHHQADDDQTVRFDPLGPAD